MLPILEIVDQTRFTAEGGEERLSNRMTGVDISMDERSRLIEKLVTTLHLNVAERQAFVTAPRKTEISAVIAKVLGDHGYFPQNARPMESSSICFEGHFLEALANGRVRLWWQRPPAIEPSALAEQRHTDFSNAADAIDTFIRQEWRDATIDGVRFQR